MHMLEAGLLDANADSAIIERNECTPLTNSPQGFIVAFFMPALASKGTIEARSTSGFHLLIMMLLREKG